MQRTVEQNSARRKQRRITKRLAAKPSQTASHVIPKLQLGSVPEDRHANNVQTQLLANKKFKTTDTKGIDGMILKGLQDKYKQRLKAAEKDSFDFEAYKECSDFDSSSKVEEEERERHDYREVDKAYAALVNESANSSNYGPPLLLPAVIQPMDKVNVKISSADSDVKGLVQVQQYIKEVVDERDAAFHTVRLLRNKVEELHSEKRKLYYEMNNKIDTVRKFWRNRLVEGDTRSGLCVKLAVQKKV